MKKAIIGVAVLLIVGGLLYYISSSRQNAVVELATYSQDSTVEGGLAVKPGEQITIKNNATVRVNGDFDLQGTLYCADGTATVIVKGKTNVSGEVRCAPEDGSLSGVALVVEGGLTMAQSAVITTNGHVQIAGDEDDLLTSAEDIARKYDETGQASGEGVRVGPFVNEGGVSVAPAVMQDAGPSLWSRITRLLQVGAAEAQVPVPVLIAGKITVMTPPPGVKQLVLFNFPDATEVTIADFELTGPDGRKGADDKDKSCSAKGKEGEDAFRFNAFAPNLKVNNFTLNLGSGGAGGEAVTTKDCSPGRAEGGRGGASGNFKMTGAASFSIEGDFLINPGYGGAGGGATAYGKDGAASEDGGNATAIGGRGADNKKALSMAGSVAGVENVTVGDLVAGAGGSALAEPGNGGAGAGCGKAGGRGGNGGSASATEGRGGMGSTGRQSDGTVLDETGGNAGNGGDGCREGKGGTGGTGDPKGTDGKDGKNLCGLPPKTETQVDPGRETKIKVISYKGKYLPVDQLIIEDEVGCGAEHWHAAQGVVKATDGSQVYDPGPQCGYGKVRDLPVQEISAR